MLRRVSVMDEELVKVRERVAVLEALRGEDQKAVALVATGFKFLLLLIVGILGLVLRGK